MIDRGDKNCHIDLAPKKEGDMSFEKARDLIDLYIDLCSSYAGLTLDHVIEKHRCSKRTAQRMLHMCEYMFGAEPFFNDDGRKVWRVRDNIRKELIDVSAEELSTLKLAEEALRQKGQDASAQKLASLQNKIKALIPQKRSFAVATDYEALLEAQGYASRQGPRPILDEEVLRTVNEAIKACQYVTIDYKKSDGDVSQRTIAIYGLLYGQRPYLVAHTDGQPDLMRLFRLDRITMAALQQDYFDRDEGFDLNDFSRKSYAVFQNDQEYGPVEWVFSKRAADEARLYQFHPDQELIDHADGRLTVKFMAAGYLEMCWDLYKWGQDVLVIKPKALKEMVEGHQRDDFKALP